MKEVLKKEDNIKNSNDCANLNVTGLMINSVFWRSGRKDNIDELKKLLDPASIFEIYICNLDEGSNNDPNTTSIDYEDIYGYYDALGGNISRTSSDQEICDVYAKIKK